MTLTVDHFVGPTWHHVIVKAYTGNMYTYYCTSNCVCSHSTPSFHSTLLASTAFISSANLPPFTSLLSSTITTITTTTITTSIATNGIRHFRQSVICVFLPKIW
ncbi:hypothetical protein L6452_19114 [Arctium lappa]|uniref:Uncharacterized protein n=1 Tax=Arctium lappa TaxID=4217 RepID=A0ACB9B7P4_ARCLA|nr:hypothetical protein L6452_19114 [Arctium lappa]